MFRSKGFVILILALALGLFTEGLKALRDFTGKRTTQVSDINASEIDATPYYVSRKQMNESRVKLAQVDGRRLGGFKLQGQNDLVKQFVAAGQSPKLDTKKPTSTVAKAEDKKKKKKKKKSARGKNKDSDKETEIAKTQDSTEGDKNSAEDSDSSTQYTPYYSPQAPIANNKEKEEEKIPVSYDDWAKLVLGKPSPENVNKLIEYNKSGLVSDVVFYRILNAMLEEQSEQQQVLAVNAAGDVRSSDSFEFLVLALKTRSENPQVTESATKHINSYQNIQNVSYLRAVISSNLSEETTLMFALTTLDKSTERYIEGRKPADSGLGMEDDEDLEEDPNEIRSPQAERDPNEGNERTYKAAELARVYKGFEKLLTNVITVHAGQSQIVDSAQRSLSRINSIQVVSQRASL